MPKTNKNFLNLTLSKTTSSFLSAIQVGSQLKIHSLYKNSANITIDNNYLLNLQFKDGLLATRAALVDLQGTDKEELKKRLKGVGKVEEDSICFSAIKFSFKESAVIDNTEEKVLQGISCSFEELKVKAKKMLNFLKLVECNSIFLNNILDNKISSFIDSDFEKKLYREVSSKLKELKRSLRKGNETIITDTLRDLIGLGPGLTPSGDDFSIGFYSIRKVLNQKFKLELINPKMLGNVSNFSFISTCLLNDIEESFYPEIFIRILGLILGFELEDFFEEFKKIKDFGHTSGEDLLAGILFGIIN